MKSLSKLEETAMFLLGIFAFSRLDYSWWWFAGLFFLPDIGMLGYLWNSKVGAWTYNAFHHKGLAIVIFVCGLALMSAALEIAGIILFAHGSFDRMLGYGLKYESGFKNTHLGNLDN
ncbi:MAG: DUF4260 domain-containing protein [Bacteroidota bacterium]|nr:DUF4260 domain-containing protein [Bacteroidota bacterium]